MRVQTKETVARAKPARVRPTHSITTSLTMGLAAVSFIVFVLVGALLQWTLQRALERAQAQAIDGKADVVQHFVDEAREPGDLPALRHRLDDVLIGDGQLRIWLVAQGGEVLYGGAQRPRTDAHRDGRLIVWREDGVALTGKAFHVAANHVVPATEVLIARDARDQEQLLRNYREALLLACGLGLSSIVGLSAWITRRALQPVHQLSREAAAIAPDALSIRLSAAGQAAELQVLVHSFNRALDRVQAAYEHLEAFSADVAHELRTPLATMISGAEVTLTRPRSADELAETLVSNLEELRQLAAMVNDMLFLANSDRGSTAPMLQTVDLAEQARQVADYFEAMLAERFQNVQIVGSGQAPANPPLLRRAIVNLVSNACRYTESGGQITIEVSGDASGARVAVRNPGSGIEASALPRLFDRFFRADMARQRAGDHHGLGLAIVRAIARMHGGQTFASSKDGVTEVGFTLGVSSTQATPP